MYLLWWECLLAKKGVELKQVNEGLDSRSLLLLVKYADYYPHMNTQHETGGGGVGSEWNNMQRDTFIKLFCVFSRGLPVNSIA